MRIRSVLLLLLLVLTGWGVLRAQRPFKAYPGQEYENFPLPPDWQKTAEFTRARLHYPSFLVVHTGANDGYDRWTIDYPRSDRHLLQGIRRLTRIDTRSVEQVVDLDYQEDPTDVYNWPFMYAVEVGYWNLTDAQAAQLRDYLLRGGFFMCDDFHGSVEWANFVASMKRVFPGSSHRRS